MFITFEGIDGAGKTTQLRRFAEFLRGELGLEVVLTSEPYYEVTNKSQFIEFVTNKDSPPGKLALLFTMNRKRHLVELIYPALDDNAIVLCDRYFHSTLAYQGYGRGVSSVYINFLHAKFCDNLQPDVIFYLRCSPDIAANRIKARGGDSYDVDYELQQRVYNGYDAIIKRLVSYDNTLPMKDRPYLIDIDTGTDERTTAIEIKRCFDEYLKTFDIHV